MKPIAIFQHTTVGAPGSIPAIFEDLHLPYQIIRIIDGQAVPEDASQFSGLVFMGGYMSVYDGLPWIAQEIALIQQADTLGIPVAGHCLGSQLVATAFGGKVRSNRTREICWNNITVDHSAIAKQWWGAPEGQVLLTFQWHGDTFSLPPGAVRIATSAYCENQAFVVNDRHMAIQSHLEMTPSLVALSFERNGKQLETEYARGNPAANSPQQLMEHVPQKTQAIRHTLTRLYTHWSRNCPV